MVAWWKGWWRFLGSGMWKCSGMMIAFCTSRGLGCLSIYIFLNSLNSYIRTSHFVACKFSIYIYVITNKDFLPFLTIIFPLCKMFLCLLFYVLCLLFSIFKWVYNFFIYFGYYLFFSCMCCILLDWLELPLSLGTFWQIIVLNFNLVY